MARPKEGDGIKSNIIVHEVQKRPCLFDSNHPHYGDRSEKARCWEEVCECIVPGWAVLGLADKLATGKDIQKRWRSIRDSFTKAYRQGKCVPPENCTPNSKRFNYHKQMSFLLKALQNKKPRYSLDRNDSDLSNSPQPFEELLLLPKLADAGFTIKPMLIKTKPEPCDPEKLDHMEIKNPCLETKFDPNSILPSDYFEDDKLFMNSLLPLFKKMDDDTRLMCRIEVLKIIRLALQGKKGNVTNIDDCMEPNKETTGSTLSMTTRSADGSRPLKRRRTHSPSPIAPKKRGPGRPRKIRPPSTDDDDLRKITCHKNKLHANKIQINKIKPNKIQENKMETNILDKMPFIEPRMSELEEKLSTVTSVAQLETHMFMKMYNLERAKVTSTSNQVADIPIKSEPVEPVQINS